MHRRKPGVEKSGEQKVTLFLHVVKKRYSWEKTDKMCIPWGKDMIGSMRRQVKPQIHPASWRWLIAQAHFPESVLGINAFRTQNNAKRIHAKNYFQQRFHLLQQG
jgi:hypothetical protein